MPELLWTNDGPLCPECGKLMVKDPDGLQWHCCPCGATKQIVEAVARAATRAVIGKAIGAIERTIANSGPAEFIEMVLGVELDKVQAAMFNSRFATRQASEARALFWKETGLKELGLD